jgi:hypothetical protein
MSNKIDELDVSLHGVKEKIIPSISINKPVNESLIDIEDILDPVIYNVNESLIDVENIHDLAHSDVTESLINVDNLLEQENVIELKTLFEQENLFEPINKSKPKFNLYNYIISIFSCTSNKL